MDYTHAARELVSLTYYDAKNILVDIDFLLGT